jgi:hypothetical protein
VIADFVQTSAEGPHLFYLRVVKCVGTGTPEVIIVDSVTQVESCVANPFFERDQWQDFRSGAQADSVV